MLDYAKKENIKLVAYAYPTLGFMQNPEWTAWCDNKPGGYSGVDTGVRSFQDWFTDQLVAFYKQTGIGGYSFDHWWIAYGGKASSKYAQWNGCRRILETLRKRVPDVMIDGRQQYHWFGPWTWLAGSYPHPMMSDEQPGSFEAFPDLHTDRVSANRTRYVNYMLRVTKFTPVELIPGFITHQTQRSDMKKDYRHERFRPRDWDYLGWKYSLISSIGTAPMNHVVNMIPARAEEEFKNFSKQDMAFFKGWMAWTDTNRDILKNLEPIIGQPMVGRVDGTAAIVGEHGYVFLYNPNYRVLDGVFRLDGSIGLTNGSMFVLKELYPQSGRLIGKPGEGFWQYGDEARIALEGTSALVLEVIPAAGMTNKPVLFNVRGEATLDRNTVALTGVVGTIGTTEDILVALPAMPDKAILTVNGKKVSCATNGKLLSAAIPFSGTAFGHSQQIGKYDPAFKGRTYKQTFRIPKRIFSQLAERKKEWPVTYTEDDLLATWLGSDRLLLYIDIADPKEEMAIGLKINGQDVTVKKAYNSIYPNGRNRTFMGFYADLSDLKPDTVYDCEVTLPELEPGQFQGLFFENVETEYTDTIKGK